MGVRVGVAYWRDKLALRTRVRNLNLKSQLSFYDSFRDVIFHICDLLSLWSLNWAWKLDGVLPH